MTAAELEKRLHDAMEPYLIAWMSKPDEAHLTVVVDGGEAKGTFTIASSDFNRVRGDSTLRGHFSTCFNKLCRKLDDTQSPSLGYAKA